MLISCKCSNFVASTSKLQRSNSSSGAGGRVGGAEVASGEVPTAILLSQVFQQKYPLDFVFYSHIMEFFKHVSLSRYSTIAVI